MLKQMLLLGAVVFAGCATGSAEDGEAAVANAVSTKQAMVGGTVSTTAQDSVVYLKGTGSCSGTLIAPNLVLTALHCVAEPAGEDECSGFGELKTPSGTTVKVGVSAGWETGTTVAKGKKFFRPSKNSGCGHDVALILLDKDVPNAKVAKVRFTPLKKNEPTTAVGYGIDENENELPKRMQRNTTILGVGPATINYKMQDGNTFTYEAPDGDVVTGESTCSGDSGGPLFDAKGAIVAMTSRGPFDGPTGGNHGPTGCGDMVSIYASTIMNKDIILAAAKEAGHPLDDDGEGGLDTQSTSEDEEDEDTGSATDEGEDEEEDAEDKPKAKRKKTLITSSGGCSSAPGHESGGAGAFVLVVGLALVSAKRRASARR